MTPTPEQLFAQIASEPGAVWLDDQHDGWSFVAWGPSALCTDVPDWPAAARAMSGTSTADHPLPGGVIGYLGYGAGAAVEAVPVERTGVEPPVWLARYDGVMAYRDGVWRLHGPRSFRARAESLLERASPLPAAPPPPRTVPLSRTRKSYANAVRGILEAIAAGDCYQVNLSRPTFVHDAGPAWPAYRRLRSVSSARFGAFLRLTDALAVLSNSPEELVRLDGRSVTSEPIKGTRPRGSDAQEDTALALDLETSEKERAELMMIVDLVRNDLGRVAVPGSVVAHPRKLTAHANVHHASARVTAELPNGADAWDLLSHLLPFGSITGAPKIAACQQIDRYERAPRGVYCGAIGYVADNGRAHFSVGIRTAVFAGPHARYHVGGGIVADSDPDAEYDETVAKGSALRAALGVSYGASSDDNGRIS